MEQESAQPDTKPRPGRSPWRRTIIIITSVLIACALLFFVAPFLLAVFVAQPVKVEGAAMSPTLNDGDRVFVSKDVAELRRGDIVVFHYPQDTTKSFVKRIVGLPGETIKIDREGKLYINGVLTNEPYVAPERNQGPRTVPEQTIKADHYYVLGDNRDASNDSRTFGAVSKDLIYGKVVMRYWPLGKPLKG
ncbi:MAG TPA: signal peptidase I [Blastocatellia bacterium]|nr:signal peptidase I [Blastocatellia bacterium]